MSIPSPPPSPEETVGSAGGYTQSPSGVEPVVAMLGCILVAGARHELVARDALERGAELFARTPPAWDAGIEPPDLEAWWFGSFAAYQTGGGTWKAWERALQAGVLATQRRDGELGGSWDPPGTAGRVRATALFGLCVEIYFRYPMLVGPR